MAKQPKPASADGQRQPAATGAAVEWFEQKVKGTPLAGLGENLYRYCVYDYSDKPKVKDYWKNPADWLNYCFRATYAVAQHEQRFCLTKGSQFTRNCWSIHPSYKIKSYTRWDGKSQTKKSDNETMRVYATVDDAMRDFVHLVSMYYYLPIMKSPYGNNYATDPNWKRDVMWTYNQ